MRTRYASARGAHTHTLLGGRSTGTLVDMARLETPLTTPPRQANTGRGLLYALAVCSVTLVGAVLVFFVGSLQYRSPLVAPLGILAFLAMLGDLFLAPVALYRLLRNPDPVSALNWLVVFVGLLVACACLFLVVKVLI